MTIATSEPLVPRGLPQGSRQAIRQARLQAGLNLDVPANGSQPRGAVPPVSPSTQGPLGLLLENPPDDFPFLGEQAAQPASSPGSVGGALALSAQSDFARAVSARLAQTQ